MQSSRARGTTLTRQGFLVVGVERCEPLLGEPSQGDVVAPAGIGAGLTEVPAWTPPTWEAVVREHSARVYRLAYRLTGNSHDAEDLTQEVFVRVFRSLPTYT